MAYVRTAMLLTLLALINPRVTLACDAKLQRDFEARYRAYAEAVRTMQADKYIGIFAADFKMTSPDGTVHDAAEMTTYMRVNAQTTQRVNSYANDVQCVRALHSGDVAVVVWQKYDRQQAPLDHPEQAHNIRTSAVQREIWRKTRQGWRIRSIEELVVGPVFMDGKRTE